MRNIGKLFALAGAALLLVEAAPERRNYVEKPPLFDDTGRTKPKQTCSLCSTFGFERCPNEVVKLTLSQEEFEATRANKNGLVDLMKGILKTMHTSSHAELQRVRMKAEEEIRKMQLEELKDQQPYQHMDQYSDRYTNQ